MKRKRQHYTTDQDRYYIGTALEMQGKDGKWYHVRWVDGPAYWCQRVPGKVVQ